MRHIAGWAGLLLLSSLLAAAAGAQDVHIAPGSAPGAPAGVTPQAPPPPPAPGSTPAAGATQPVVPGNVKNGDATADKLSTFTSNVNEVMVPVTITDPMNRMVTGLEADYFSVYEDNVPQRINSFGADDAPISVGVIFDSSGSMSDKIDKSRQALLQFFKTANPQDEFFMIDFSDQPRLLCAFTSDIDKIEDSVNLIQAHGRTALLDSIYLGLDEMRQARYNRKALLIISDGGDNDSRYTEREVLRVVRETDVQVYAIGVYSPVADRPTPEEVNGPELLNEITDATGGRTFAIQSVDDLPDVATRIGIELRNEYVLGYSPTNAVRDGKWRKISIRLHPPAGLPPLTVSARPGYFGPQ